MNINLNSKAMSYEGIHPLGNHLLKDSAEVIQQVSVPIGNTLNKFIHDLKTELNLDIILKDFAENHIVTVDLSKKLIDMAGKIAKIVSDMKILEKETDISSATTEIKNKIKDITIEFFNLKSRLDTEVKKEKILFKADILDSNKEDPTSTLAMLEYQFNKIQQFLGMPLVIERPYNVQEALQRDFDRISISSLRKDEPESKNAHEFKITIDPKLNAIYEVKGTPDVNLDISRILTNLLNNSIKYGGKFIYVTASWIEDTKTKDLGNLVITVSDTGKGIVDVDNEFKDLTEKEVVAKATRILITSGSQSTQANSLTGSGLGGASFDEILGQLDGSFTIKIRGGGFPKEYPSEIGERDRIGTEITAFIPLQKSKQLEVPVDDIKDINMPLYSPSELDKDQTTKLSNTAIEIILVEDGAMNRMAFNRVVGKLDFKPLSISMLGKDEDLASLKQLKDEIKKKITTAIQSKKSIVVLIDKTLGHLGEVGNDLAIDLRQWYQQEAAKTEDLAEKEAYQNIKHISYSGNLKISKNEYNLYDGFLEKALSPPCLRRCLYESIFPTADISPTNSLSDMLETNHLSLSMELDSSSSSLESMLRGSSESSNTQSNSEPIRRRNKDLVQSSSDNEFISSPSNTPSSTPSFSLKRTSSSSTPSSPLKRKSEAQRKKSKMIKINEQMEINEQTDKMQE